MSRPLMLQKGDAERIEALKLRLRARTKTEIVRSALTLLERDADRAEREIRWRRAAKVAAPESRKVHQDFQPYSRLSRIK